MIARQGREVSLAAMDSEKPPRVDAIPAGLLALFVELGIHPHAIGAHDLHESILSTWRDEKPRLKRTSAKVHIDRGALERELQILSEHAGVKLVSRNAVDSFDNVIDATGRRAICAEKVVAPDDPWIARVWHHSGEFSHTQGALRIAPTNIGYAYRIGTRTELTVGFVTPRSMEFHSSIECEACLRCSGGGWVLAGIPKLQSLRGSRGGTASVQWSCNQEAVALGDSFFAPDALASQGIALGVSAALRFVRGELDAIENRLSHLTNLRRMIGECRYNGFPSWRSYDAFLAEHSRAQDGIEPIR